MNFVFHEKTYFIHNHWFYYIWSTWIPIVVLIWRKIIRFIWYSFVWNDVLVEKRKRERQIGRFQNHEAQSRFHMATSNSLCILSFLFNSMNILCRFENNGERERVRCLFILFFRLYSRLICWIEPSKYFICNESSPFFTMKWIVYNIIKNMKTGRNLLSRESL